MRRFRWLLPAALLLLFCFLGGLRWGGSKGTASLLSGLAVLGLRPILNGQGVGIGLLLFFFDFLLLAGLLSLGWFRPILALITLPLPLLLASFAGVVTALLPKGAATVLLILWETTMVLSLTAITLIACERAVYHLSFPGADSTDVLRLRLLLSVTLFAALTGAILLLCLRKTSFFGFFQTLL